MFRHNSLRLGQLRNQRDYQPFFQLDNLVISQAANLQEVPHRVLLLNLRLDLVVSQLPPLRSSQHPNRRHALPFRQRLNHRHRLHCNL